MKTSLLIPGLISGLYLLGFQAVLLPDLPSIASGSSVDEYIEQSNIQTIDADDVANQAKASRERYFAEKENSTLDWDMPSSLSGSGSTPSESRITAREQSSTDVQDFSRQPSEISSDAQVESNESVMADASGTWSLRLTDSIQRDVSLALFQEGASIFGSGSLRENNSTNQVMASGTLQGDLLSLDLTTQQPITLYKLLLNMSNDDASGKYSAISSGGDKWTGQVDGFRLAA